MNKLPDALETCLAAIEQGKDLDAALADFPDMAAELRPLLEVAAAARREATSEMPPHVLGRIRSSFLQNASEMRERRLAPRRRIIPALPRTALTLVTVLVLVLTSTGLVSASSGSLPGDQLYTVKRSWEDLRLVLALQPQEHYLLESEYEQERLNEISEMLAKGRSHPITFSGIITQRMDGTWQVSGIPVAVGKASQLPAGTIAAGAPVSVTGITRADGVVEAQSITLLQPGGALPPLEPSEHDGEADQHEQDAEGYVAAATPAPAVSTPEVQPQEPPQTHEFTGIVQALGTDQWRINGQLVYVQGATVVGSVKVGAEVRFQGYYAPDGRFVVTSIQVTTNISHKEDKQVDESGSKQSGSGSDGGSSSGGSDDGGSDGGGSDDGGADN